jgi:hypothetical protein
MATVSKRVLGNMRGRLADAVFSKWKTLYVAKGRPGKRKNKNPDAPLSKQNLRIQMISTAQSYFADYISIGFSSKYAKATPYTRALKNNLKHAIKGTYPDFEIDYSKFIVSQGPREVAWGGKMYFEPSSFLRVTWKIPKVCDVNEIGDDTAYIVVYQPGGKFVYTFKHGRFTALRRDLTYRARLTYDPELPGGGIVHVWIFFISPDGKQSSDSIYLGSGYINNEQA